MNRAVGQRAMFESARDVGRFVDRLRSTVERGWIEVHAFAILQTHYHLLLLSLLGTLSQAMHYLQAPYASWFNWSRERDGPLHRGRFRSRPVDSLRYRRQLVRYIDANPVIAGLARTPQDYPHCSARHYARRSGPDWLTRTWVEREVVENRALRSYDPGQYPGVFAPSLPEATRRVIERDIESGDRGRQDIDLLLRIGRTEFAEWLHRRARLADGTRALRPIVDPGSILAAVRSRFPVPPRRTGRGAWSDSEVGFLCALLLRTLAGQRIREIGDHLRCSPATASRLWRTARQRVETDGAFATVAASLAHSVTRSFWESR